MMLLKRLSPFMLLTLTLLSPLSAEQLLEVKIEGIEDELALKNATNAASISFYNEKEAPSSLRLKWLHKESEKEIVEALYPFGYYRATVQGDITYSDDKVTVTYYVKPNEQIPITTLNLSLHGYDERFDEEHPQRKADYAKLEKVIQETKLKKGEALDHKAYEETKSTLLAQAVEFGFFDAEFREHRVLVDLNKYEASIDLALELGRRYRFGESTFHHDYFREEFLDRFLHPVREGRDYSDESIVNLQADFNKSGYFDDVIILPRPDQEAEAVPLDIYLKLRKKRTFNAGLGYSTDIGFKVSSTLTWHYINRWGHKLTTGFLWGQKKRDGIIDYEIPGSNPTQDRYNLYLKYNFEDTKYKDYTTFIIGGAKTRERELYSYGFGLDYQYDRFRDIEGGTHKTYLFMPFIFGEWKTARTVEFEEPAFKISGKLRGSASSLLSDISFLQAQIKMEYYMPISEKNRFIFRGELGHTKIDSNDLTKLPPSVRFYAGGDNSVRGYRLDGIGEYGYRNEIVGGKKLAVISAEYEHKVRPDFAAALFIDAGDAFNGSRPSFKVGAGAGIRWYSPIGSVRFDLAHGFNKRLGDTVRLHLTIGAEL